VLLPTDRKADRGPRVCTFKQVHRAQTMHSTTQTQPHKTLHAAAAIAVGCLVRYGCCCLGCWACRSRAPPTVQLILQLGWFTAEYAPSRHEVQAVAGMRSPQAAAATAVPALTWQCVSQGNRTCSRLQCQHHVSPPAHGCHVAQRGKQSACLAVFLNTL
jgi:hypothetical protein